jgi:integrase
MEAKQGEFWRRSRKLHDGRIVYGKKLWTRLFGQRVPTGQTTERLARIWKNGQLEAGADPRRAAAAKARLDGAIREMYAELRRRGRSDATQKKVRQKLAHFPRLWGEDCKLATIDLRKIQKYVDTRLGDLVPNTERTVSRLTIRDELAALRQVLKLARRQGMYHHAIDDVFDRFETGHSPKRDWCNKANLEKLLAHVTPAHQAHLLFFVCTAGRLADSLRARPEDFDTAKWRAHVRGSKTKGSLRTIPIEPIIRPYVKRMLKLAEGEQSLFLPWTNIHRSLREACANAGISPVTTNGLRRTFGKLHRLAGYSLDTISKLYGHTTAKLVRDVYADVEGDELAELTEMERTRTKTVHRAPKAAGYSKKGSLG